MSMSMSTPTPSRLAVRLMLSLLLLAPAAACDVPPAEDAPPGAGVPPAEGELPEGGDPGAGQALITTTGATVIDPRVLQLAPQPPRDQFVIASRITSISPGTVNRGDTLNVLGTNLRGVLLTTSVAVRLQAGAQRVDVVPFHVTATELRLVVPANATTGPVELIGRPSNAVLATAPAQLVVNVPVPTTGTLRVNNNSQYDVIQLIVGGQNVLPANQVIPPGGRFDVTRAGGAVAWTASLGFSFAIFDWNGNSTVVNGQQVSGNIPRITAAMALTLGQASARFAGTYWVGLSPHSAELVFFSNGSFQLWNDGSLLGQGTVVDGAFLSGSSIIQFSLTSGAQSFSTSFDTPYASFLLQNGPPEWPTIEYVRQ
jgi:hypothetical protein